MSFTLLHLSTFRDMFEVLLHMVLSYTQYLVVLLLPTLMLIRSAVMSLVVPPLIITYSWVPIYFPGPPNSRTQYRGLIQKPDIGGVANIVAEICWIPNLLIELHYVLAKATIVYCDNMSSVYMSPIPVHHHHTKHIEIDLHFVCDKVSIGQVRVLHVPSSSQYADTFTKSLPSPTFLDFRSSLNVHDFSPIQSMRGLLVYNVFIC